MPRQARLDRLRARFENLGIDALYVTNLVNIRYLSGFTGSAASMLVGPSQVWFFTDGRYRTQVGEQVSGCEIVIHGREDLGKAVGMAAASMGVGRVGFESETATVSEHAKLKTYFEGPKVISVDGVIQELRKVKDHDEVAAIQRAAELADQGFAYIAEKVRPGMTERELALDLEYQMRGAGAEDVSFPPIVAAAERSALPHARPTDRRVEKGRFLLFDLGFVIDGYCSDMTRTLVVGEADREHSGLYEIVRSAQQAAVEAVAPGVQASAVDAAARDPITSAGHGEAFAHGLGHGVGMMIHEAPVLNQTTSDVLEPGHVVTVEPGVYLPGFGGVRIEDLILVTQDGAEVLSKTPKDLRVL